MQAMHGLRQLLSVSYRMNLGDHGHHRFRISRVMRWKEYGLWTIVKAHYVRLGITLAMSTNGANYHWGHYWPDNINGIGGITTRTLGWLLRCLYLQRN